MHVDAHAGGEEGKHQQGYESAHAVILAWLRARGMTGAAGTPLPRAAHTNCGYHSGVRFQFLPSNDSSGWKRRL